MIDIGVTTPEHYRAAADVLHAALLKAPPTDDQFAAALPSWQDSDSLVALDGGRVVAHAAGYRLQTRVPGGARVPTSGVTRVGVLPSHRRQGIASALVTQLLRDAAERGQALASLRASDARIYGRYGFGLAGRAAEILLVSAQASAGIEGAAPGTMRILRRDEVIGTVPTIYDRYANRNGVITRPDWMWLRYLGNALETGGDAEYIAVHTCPDGVDDGYVHYGVAQKGEPATAFVGTGEVLELWGADASVELALWDYLVNIDLVQTWTSQERPIDDLISVALRDFRAYRTQWLWDEQWLRILDVDAALAARTYADAQPVTICVTDPLLPANNGRWRLGPNASKRLASTGAADLTADVRELACTYLGDTRWSGLVAVGRVRAAEPDAARRADALFATPQAPGCGSFF